MMCARSDRTCATCQWWERKGPRLANAVRDPSAHNDTGTCQAHAPMVVQATAFPVSLFPVTHETRFCGEWQGVDEGGGGGEKVANIVPIVRAA